MIVVDTNILIYYYVKGDYTEMAAQVYAKNPVWVAPFLWRSEFRNVTLRYLQKEILTLPQILKLAQAAELLMRDHEFHVATDDVYRLAGSSSCSAYDCEYVALAQALDVQLVTLDKQVLRAFPDIAVSMSHFLGR
ncbi:hypothetical protein MNBD_CHLOROFLEXI01-4509 [hydrothermal vent metagenome]|uniref:PIN domain-containing protein n=1 Tax=hydrothermal vent metagenome TaxID=652676 RepID=A0A3B0V1H0_9ZZZZ